MKEGAGMSSLEKLKQKFNEKPILFGTGEVLNAKGKGIYLYELKDGQLSLISRLRLFALRSRQRHR